MLQEKGKDSRTPSKSDEKLVQRYVAFILRHRFKVLALILLVTAFFGYKICSLRIATDFFTLYPPKHPYIQLYNEYRKMFGSANVLVCAIEVKNGTIYNLETIGKIDRITKQLLEIPGCDALQLISITHPKLKNVQVSAWGITMEPVMHPGLPTDEQGVERLKNNIYTNEGIRGFFVSPDDKSAAIFAGFWEEGLNPMVLYESMNALKKAEEDGNTKIYFSGFPVLYAYIYAKAPELYAAFAATVLVTLALLYYYFRTVQGVMVPLISGILSAVWGLGFASFLGYNLDPLILVVPLIILARDISHSVQCLARYNEEYAVRKNQREAIIHGYGELFTPAALSVATDTIGIFLISVATIPLMRQLGFFASFWFLTTIVSVPTLSPIIVSFLRPPKIDTIERQFKGRFYDAIAKVLIKPSIGKGRVAVGIVVVLILVVGGLYSRQLKIGDTEMGNAILFRNHPYNEAFRFFNQNFIGATQMVIIAEGKEEGALKNAEGLLALEDFQRFMESEGLSSGTLTFTNVVKRINRMFHEGQPKWEKIPTDNKAIGEIGFIVSNNASAGEMDRWIDPTWTNATITCFYKDYNNASIKQALSKAQQYIDTHRSDKINFRLAGGLMGILAAVNQEVEYSYYVSLTVVFVACFALCALTFRSLAAGLILIFPLLISQILTDSFMVLKGIDLNINSLPVAAIAVGIGINYGIYLLARISEEYQKHQNYNIANSRTLESTGKAIIFTATTCIAGVVFWAFVDVKFQSEMGLLLAILMFLNMVAALILIPTLVVIFKPKFVAKTKMV